MLYLIGLGLGDEKDISLKGLEAVKRCSEVYLEAYTSLLSTGLRLAALEELYGRPVILADREMVEQEVEQILEQARTSDIAFLVVGDPFGATTHSDLVVRARKMRIEVKVIHNASVMNAVGICGLQLYRFGEAVSIPFFTETWTPDSFYDKIKANRLLGLHIVLARGKKVYEPPKFMTINTAIEQLLQIEKNRAESVYDSDTTCVGLVRLGSEAQKIVVGSMRELLTVDFGPPLHCLIIVGSTHPIEDEMLEIFAVPKACLNAQNCTG